MRARADRLRLMRGSTMPVSECGRAAGLSAANEVGRGGEWAESEVAGPTRLLSFFVFYFKFHIPTSISNMRFKFYSKCNIQNIGMNVIYIYIYIFINLLFYSLV
jgi:hypothetical protein